MCSLYAVYSVERTTSLEILRIYSYDVIRTTLLELRCLNCVVNLPLSYLFLTSLTFCKDFREAFANGIRTKYILVCPQ
jgi:hypothetical protein